MEFYSSLVQTQAKQLFRIEECSNLLFFIYGRYCGIIVVSFSLPLSSARAKSFKFFIFRNFSPICYLIFSSVSHFLVTPFSYVSMQGNSGWGGRIIFSGPMDNEFLLVTPFLSRTRRACKHILTPNLSTCRPLGYISPPAAIVRYG